MPGDHELSDFHAARDTEGGIAVVDQHRLDLAAVVAVDRARGVQQCDAVVQRQSRAGADLRLEPMW